VVVTPKSKEMTMTWLLMNVPLMIVFLGLWVAVPLWLVLRHRETAPKPATAEVRYLALRSRARDDGDHRHAA
jgi:hypothetical protein